MVLMWLCSKKPSESVFTWNSNVDFYANTRQQNGMYLRTELGDTKCISDDSVILSVL